MADSKQRVLSVFAKLINGERLSKADLENQYSISNKSAQRDFSDIREMLAENALPYELLTDTESKYYLKNTGTFNEKDILVLIMLLNLVRPFNKSEYNRLIKSLLGTQSAENQKKIKKVINSEATFYTPINHKKPLLDLIWDLRDAIEHQNKVEIHYIRGDGVKKLTVVCPMAVLAHHHYFYLVSTSEKYPDQPIQRRLDRISSYKILPDTFKINHAKAFNLADFRKHNPNMYVGKTERLKAEITGSSWEEAVDRFPDHEILEEFERDGKQVKIISFRATTGDGLMIWLLSQNIFLKLLEPQYLIDEMKGRIEQMLGYYE